eukprot:CAMPEP_0119326096 /NCGR_PEP_ID=MMETSP1333-20130426/67457_1 /TAXON_ID=418940 /ORGANISM="Scyphosphaera apsteinii, Strain RCC1455" /LENGTH=559 /DNA_ID=CAMNT_0007334293 /DNA_START=81 /DNA_END=1760 /DNA_ORIENTATION=-
MSAREAEEINRELARANWTKGGVFMFVPVGSSAPAKTTTSKIYIGRNGEWLSRSQTSSAGPRRGKSSSIYAEPGSASSGQFMPPSITQQRSKRPKVQAQPSRTSLGVQGDVYGVPNAMKPCYKLLKTLISQPHAWPFEKPVDPTRYPDYYQIVPDPIDLGTIKKRLESGELNDQEDFAEDVRRVWKNCYMYNQDGTDVHRMAKDLEQWFERKYREMPAPENVVANEQMKEMKKQMQKMQKQMQQQQELMQQQLMQQQQAMAANPLAASPGNPAPPPQSAKRSSNKKGRARQSSQCAMVPSQSMSMVPKDETRDMSFEEKSRLSASINRLTSNNLGKVVQIIKESMPSLGAGSEEIEVDLAALDNVTLWRLQAFVDGCNASKKKAKKPPTATAASRLQAIQQAEASVEAQLASLNSGLRNLDEAETGGVRGGIMLERQKTNDSRDDGDDSPSDSDSDDAGLGLKSQDHGGSGGGYFDGFSKAKMQKDRERDDSERRRQEAARREAERARQKSYHEAAAIQREREAERARRDQDTGGIDMLGQSNAMATFDGFDLDEYGGV